MYAGRFTLTPTAWDSFDRLCAAYDIPQHAPTAGMKERTRWARP